MKTVAGRRRSATDTQIRIAEALLESISTQRLKAGDHITETSVAEMFGVSRSPVRAALAILKKKRVLEQRINRGYFVRRTVEPLTKTAIKLPQSDIEAISLTIARDWFCGRLPEHFQESDFRRRYGVGQLCFARVLLKLAEDGIITRAPGRGWRFEPTLQTEGAHDESYAFRLLVEPAAILAPTFVLDGQAAGECRRQHETALARGISSMPFGLLFEIDANFHRMIAQSSRNRFFLASIDRQNRLRRLTEYFAGIERIMQSCHEHMDILDALERKQNQQASELLRQHLEVSSSFKPPQFVSPRAKRARFR